MPESSQAHSPNSSNDQAVSIHNRPLHTSSIGTVRPSDAAEAFLHKVISPLSGEAISATPGTVTIDRDSLAIKHDVVCPDGETRSLQYRINFSDESETPNAPRYAPGTRDEAVITVPRLRWTEDQTRELQHIWRRITISDPLLYPRFQRRQQVLDHYQNEGVEAISNALRLKNHALAVMATGSGKTLVNFKAVADYTESVQRDVQFSRPPASLFIVNNRLILEEAQQKLRAMYPGRFTIGKIYEGAVETDADVIFTTPLSAARSLHLVNQARTLITASWDEVHHLPAPTVRELHEVVSRISHSSPIPLKHLGFTATETRPDRESVIGFFGREIDYEYPIVRGWDEGFLAPIIYHSAFDDIIKPGTRLEVGTAAYEAFREARYSETRLPHMLARFFQHRSQMLYMKGLTLCPSVIDAEGACKFFRDHGVPSVCLNATARDRNPEWFYWHYESWKLGRAVCPPPKPEWKVPEMVFGVDLFNEGVDIQGINLLNLWNDTDSIIRFLQSIGRGLRPYPFKPELHIDDYVGFPHKLHIFTLLREIFSGKYSASKSAFQNEQSEPREIKRRKELDSEPTKLSPYATFDDSVNTTVESWLRDIPSHLHYRYGTYSQIPLGDLKLLDQFLAKRSGFDSTQKLHEFLHDTALSLPTLNDGQIQEIRARLLPGFVDHAYLAETSNRNVQIPRTGTSIIVYARIEELLLKAHEDLNFDSILRLFPEFDPKFEVISRQIGQNLRMLRTAVFGLTRAEMAAELVEALWRKESIRRDIQGRDKSIWSPGQILSSLDEQTERKEDPYTITSCEGERGAHSQNNQTQSDYRENVRTNSFEQPGLIECYRMHPRIDQKVTALDFQLESSQFKEKLLSVGLLTGDSGRLQLFKSLASLKASAFLVRDGTSRISASALGEITETLNRPSTKGLLCAGPLEARYMKQLKELSSLIIRVSLKNPQHELLNKARFASEATLELLGLAKTIPLTEYPDLYLLIESEAEDNYSVRPLSKAALVSSDGELTTASTGFSVLKIIDHNSGESLVIAPQTTIHSDGLSNLYGSSSPTQRSELINAALNAIDFIMSRQSKQAILWIPKAWPQHPFYGDLMNAIREQRSYFFFAPLLRPGLDRDIRANHSTLIEAATLSRIPALSSYRLKSLYAELGDDGSIRPSKKIAYLLVTLDRYLRDIQPRTEQIRERLKSSAALSPEDPVLAQLIEFIDERLCQQWISRGHLRILKSIYDIVEDQDSELLPARAIYLAWIEAATSPHKRDYIAVGSYTIRRGDNVTQSVSVSNAIKIISQYQEILSLYRLGAPPLPSAAAEQCERFLELTARALTLDFNGHRTSASFKESIDSEIEQMALLLQGILPDYNSYREARAISAPSEKEIETQPALVKVSADADPILLLIRSSTHNNYSTIYKAHISPDCDELRNSRAKPKILDDIDRARSELVSCPLCHTPPPDQWDKIEENLKKVKATPLGPEAIAAYLPKAAKKKK